MGRGIVHIWYNVIKGDGIPIGRLVNKTIKSRYSDYMKKTNDICVKDTDYKVGVGGQNEQAK